MKAEKINQDQIRFTLSESDLISRNLHISELSYGSDKTKALFEDMMRTAYEQFGMDFSQKPLMIEAIPLSDRELTITVTRVSGAAELGALFGANFGGPRDRGPGQDPRGLDMWSPAFADPSKGPQEGPGREEKGFFDELPGTEDGVIYLFDHLDDLCSVSSHIPENLKLINALYVDEGKGTYYLVVHFRRMDSEMRYVISLLSQYCTEWFFGRHAELIVKEHARAAIKNRALQKLGKIERSEI
ncbi:MAG: adaptor protein MecA [Firmicutes bacterium]|nr:adaptor protein MecA [Bacillota bacterium]